MVVLDKDTLSDLLLRAQGQRTREAFAKDAGVSLPQLSKIIKKEIDGPPRLHHLNPK